MVVGDHGEEFGDLGHFGHGTAFNRFQTQTIGVFHLPGAVPRVVEHVTSHMDFVPTVLTWMGVTNAPGDYATGIPIAGPEVRNWALVSGWQTAAVVREDSMTVFKPSRTIYMDKDGREISKGDPRSATGSEIMQALKETTLFYK